MKNLIVSLILFFTMAGMANAVGIKFNSENMLKSKAAMMTTENSEESGLLNPPQTARVSLQTVAVPSVTWVIGFGLCLVFLSYTMKKNDG